MKVSLNIVKFYNERYKSAPDPYSYGADAIVTRIGAQLGAVEDVVYFGKRFDGIVVARVVSCVPHDNSDHLKVCMVDDGGVIDGLERSSDGLVQVVCGAPNAREGIVVAWIPPKTVVPSTIDKDPFELSVREIRGKVSNGMLASPAELGLSDDHDGILEIDPDDVGEELAKPGTPFKKLYELDDVIIDCENKMFTHRPDCFGTLGVAREIAGMFGDSYSSPDWYKQPLQHKKTTDLSVSAKNLIPELVTRFTIQAVANVSVTKSPVWLQAYFARVGIKSISNIVDYTNYFMMLTAQPTHAFDYDKIVALCGSDPVFAPRLAKKGERIALLNGKTIELTDQDMVITANDRPVALAGVMGGSETEVSSETKNIVLECATFDLYAVRRTSMRHGLFTDAVTRFTKGQSNLQNDRVLAKLVDELVQFAGGEVASEPIDIFSGAPRTDVPIFEVKFINDRLKTELSNEDVKNILQNVEFEFPDIEGKGLLVRPPFWRTDIQIVEDLVEEVGRLYGYDKLPIELPSRSASATKRNELLDLLTSLRTKLSAQGANEIKTYSFVHGDLMKKSGIINAENYAYHLRNAISPDLQYYRIALMPSVLDKVYLNLRSDLVRSDDNEFALFEIGRVHIKGHDNKEGLPSQMERLAFVLSADEKTAKKKYVGSAYYHAKKFLDDITSNQVEYELLDTNDYPITAAYQIGRSAIVKIGGEVFGVIGEFRQSVRKQLKLPEYTAGFEIDLELFMKHTKKTSYQTLPTYPKTQQDITFEVSHEVTYRSLHDLINASLLESQKTHGYVPTLAPRDIFSEDSSDKKRLTFRIWLSHHSRTLTTEEVNSLLNSIAEVANKSLGAERI